MLSKFVHYGLLHALHVQLGSVNMLVEAFGELIITRFDTRLDLIKFLLRFVLILPVFFKFCRSV